MARTKKRGRSTMVTKRRPTRGQMARKVAKHERMLKGSTGFVDLVSATYPLDLTTTNVQLLNTVPQGSGVSQRVGKRIQLKSLQCHGAVISSGNSTVANRHWTYMIVYDSRPTDPICATTDILQAAATEGTFAFNNDTNSGRFRILKRVDSTLNGNNNTTDGEFTSNTNTRQDWYLKLNGLDQVFSSTGTAGTIGEIEKGALYLVTVGFTAVNPASLIAGFRLRYWDIHG